MCVSTKAGDIAFADRIRPYVDILTVLRGDGVVTCDVIVVFLVREVQEKVVGAGRDD